VLRSWRPRRCGEDLERATFEELGQSVRGVEEVERLARGWCVEDDCIEATGGVQLVELGYGGELL
jgi:hypothetical protein